MIKHKKFFVPFFSLLALGAIVVSSLYLENSYSRKSGGVEAEIVGIAAREKSLTGMLRDEEAEEAIERDAQSLDPGVADGIVEPPSSEAGAKEESAVSPPPAPQPETKDAGELKIGFVTDIHARSDSKQGKRTLKPFFQEGINHFVRQMDESFLPDFILADGDLIEGTGKSSSIGRKELALVRELFDETHLPTYWVVGNHDLRSVKKSQWKKALRIDYLHRSFEAGSYKIIILDSNFTSEDEDVSPDAYNTRGRVSQEELAWLENELALTDEKVLVFMHHPPLWNVDLKSNDSMPGNSRNIQEIFARHNVLAVFAGHMEDLYIYETGGVKYFVLPGFTKNNKYQKTFSKITVEKGEIKIDMSYLGEDGKYQTVRITD